MSDRAAIEAAIPHREPFLLVDEIVECGENDIRCRKRFTGNEYFFAGHYPGHPIVPGVLLCEAGMQAGAILLARRLGRRELSDRRLPVATRLQDVRFKQIVRPQETIDIQVTLDEELSGAYFLTARIAVAGKLAVRFQFACTLADPDSVH